MEPLLYHWKLDAALPFRIDFQHLEKQFENPRRDMHSAVHLGILLDGDLGMMREPHDFYWTASWEIHGGLRSENGAGLLLITFSPEILLNAVIGDKSPVRALLYLPFREKASLFRTAPVRKMTERLKIDLETMRKLDVPQQKIWLRIGGRWSKDPAERNWLLIDRVLLNGKLLPNGDFQKYREKKTDVYRPNEWILHNRAEYYLDAGENRSPVCLVNHDSPITTSFQVRAGEPNTVTIRAKVPPRRLIPKYVAPKKISPKNRFY